MFCWNCGKKIPDNSNFCMNCGAEISPVSNSLPNRTNIETKSGDVASKPKITFRVKSHTLSFDSSFSDFTTKRREFLSVVQPSIQEGGEKLKLKVKNLIDYSSDHKEKRAELDKIFLEYYDYGIDSIEMLVKTVHDNLLTKKIYSYSLDELRSQCQHASANFFHTLNEFSDQLVETMDLRNELEQVRSEQRENRGHWQGGGFGVVNAIKGAITAELMNIGEGAIRGAGDIIVDSRDNSRIFKIKLDLIKSKPWVDMLREALIKDSYSIFDVYMSILESERQGQCPPVDRANSEIYYDNAKWVKEDTEKETLLLKSIELDPYNIDPYYDLLEKYNLSKDVIRLADYFLEYYSISRIVVSYYNAITRALENISGGQNAHQNVKEAYSLLEDVLSVAKKCKDSSPFYKAFYAMYSKNLQDGLESINVSRRTSSDGIVHSTIQERDLYEEEIKKYHLYENVGNSLEEASILQKAKAEHFKSSLIQKKINSRESALKIKQREQLETNGTFEMYFSMAWSQNQSNVKLVVPEIIRDFFTMLPYGHKSKILDVWTIKGHEFFSTKEINFYLVVSDYYIMVYSEEYEYPYAIRTKNLKSLQYEISTLHIVKNNSERDLQIMSCTKESKPILTEFCNRVNQAISTVYSNASKIDAIIARSEDDPQYLHDFICKSSRRNFKSVFGNNLPDWKAKGSNYVQNVINIACKGKLDEDQIIYYWDSTLFSSGKGGLVIADSSILINTIYTKTILEYSEIDTIGWTDKGPRNLMIWDHRGKGYNFYSDSNPDMDMLYRYLDSMLWFQK